MVQDQRCATPPEAAAPARFFRAGHSGVLDEHDQALWDGLERAAEGGKRFRPRLLLGVHAALGGSQEQAATRVADALELLHTAFVLHDDVIDGDLLRRGRPNVAGTFAARAAGAGADADRARRYGEAAGVLAGDLALAGAVREVALCGAPPGVVVRLLDLLEDVLHRSAAGELADVRVSLTGCASLTETLDVAEWKTAAYSFQLPLQAGAILAGAPEQTVERLGEVGRHLGVAFQLQDDVDGIFASASTTGKSTLSDLREGKCTALVAHARATAWWPGLEPLLGRADLDEQGARTARQLLTACGARAAVEALVEDLRRAASEAAALLPGPVAALLTDLPALAASRVRGAA